MKSSTTEDQLSEKMVEILPSGKVALSRTYGLAVVELSLYVITCHIIVMAWSRFDGPSAFFGLVVAITLFSVNLLVGVYRRDVYAAHIRRLTRSGLAHGLSALLLSIICSIFVSDSKALFYLLGMVLMTYVITNTLRPVLVEIIRAGNENEQRRQPAKSVS